MVYLNKGQFYPITLQGVDSSTGPVVSKVKVSPSHVDDFTLQKLCSWLAG